MSVHVYRDDEANFPADTFHPRFDGLKLIFRGICLNKSSLATLEGYKDP